jgi:rhodanese-related sulfurtransferase
MNVALNKGGYEDFDVVLKKGSHPVSAEDFESVAEDAGALILDTRNAAEFQKGYVPNSINIGLQGDFAPWVGAMIVDVQQPILLITDSNVEEEAITRLARVGFDNVIGYLQGGFEAWKISGNEIDTVNRISAEAFANQFTTDSKVIDVRNETEYAAEHVNEAYSRPLVDINEWAATLDNDEHFYLHCAGGYRSMIAASILNSRGIRNFTEIEGGFNKIKETNVPKSNFVCQSKTLK